MTEMLSSDAPTFDRELSQLDRAVVLFRATWCGYCATFLPNFQDEEVDASVPFYETIIDEDEDPRWDTYGIEVVPTVVYFEKGEALERVEARAVLGLAPEQFKRFLERVDAINEDDLHPKLRRR